MNLRWNCHTSHCDSYGRGVEQNESEDVQYCDMPLRRGGMAYGEHQSPKPSGLTPRVWIFATACARCWSWALAKASRLSISSWRAELSCCAGIGMAHNNPMISERVIREKASVFIACAPRDPGCRFPTSNP